MQTEIYGIILKMLPWFCTHVDFSHGYDQNRNINTITGVNIISVYKASVLAFRTALEVVCMYNLNRSLSVPDVTTIPAVSSLSVPDVTTISAVPSLPSTVSFSTAFTTELGWTFYIQQLEGKSRELLMVGSCTITKTSVILYYSFSWL